MADLSKRNDRSLRQRPSNSMSAEPSGAPAAAPHPADGRLASFRPSPPFPPDNANYRAQSGGTVAANPGYQMEALATVPSADLVGTEGAALAELRRHADYARGAYATNSERAMRSDVAIFTAWCAAEGRQALPATPATVAAFIDAMASTKAPATVRRYVSSVSTFHRAAGLASPAEALEVKAALKRMHRERGRAQAQAAPLNDVLVARMLAAAGTTLRDLRDKALVAVAYTTLARRSELVAMLREDLQVDADGFGTVAVRRSKTDQEGAGAMAAITADAMRHLTAWLDAAGIEAGPLFRSVRKGGHVGDTFGEGDVARVFKAMAKAAGLSAEDVARVSGHSTRVGATQDLVRYGADLVGIMQAARWRSPEMPARYSRRLTARRNAAAQIADRRTQF
jgi:site-specific recombinase XerD